MLSILSLLFLQAQAEDRYYQEKGRGWFWKEPIPDPEQQAKPAEPPPPPPAPTKAEAKPDTPKGPEPFSSAWMRINMPAYRDRAVDKPTYENVAAYKYLERLMMNKAQKYTDMSTLVATKDKYLDQNTYYSPTAGNELVADRRITKETNSLLKRLSKNVGIWFFFRSDCPYCHQQANVTEFITEKYGMKVLPISVDGLPMTNGKYPRFVADGGQAEAMGVTTVPALFMVNTKTGKQVSLSEGLTPGTELTDRIILLAKDAGWISEAEFRQTQDVPVAIPELDAKGLSEDDAQDPKKLIEHLRAQFKSQMK